MLLGDTGLFNKAQQSEDEFKIGALKDQISTIILDWELEKKIPNTTGDETIGTLDRLWNKFVDADIIDDPDEDIYNQEGTDIYEVTTNEGYVVEIIVKEDGTVEIGNIVKGDNLPPRIGEITSSSTSNSIHVEVNITRSTGEVSISYYYKKDGEEDSSYKALKENVADLTADFTGLEQNVIYNIKVVVTDDNGSAEKVINERTGELTQAIIEQVGDLEWNNETATIKLQIGEGTELASGEKLVYQIGDIDGEWLEYPEEGISGLAHEDIVYAAISDGTNVSKESSFEIEDNIVPNSPTISLSGTPGNNSYYRSNVTVTIVAGSDGQSGVKQVRYSVSGAQTVSQTTTAAGTTTATMTITAEGTSTVTAYTLDKAGNVSTAKTQVVYKDSTAPSTASLTVETVGETSIAVTAKGADATSGIYSYQFQRSTTSSTSGFTTVATQTSTATNLSYTYTGLTEGTTYYLRVIVTDKAGNTKTGTAVTQATKSYPTIDSILEEGNWVYYYDKNNTRRKCIVLYGPENENYSSYGVQIITDDTVESVELGNGTGTTFASKNTTHFNTAMNSYNNAINILNTRAMAYLNITYTSDARCVGSVPDNKNYQSGYFTSPYSYMSSYNGKLRDKDANYERDYNQIGTLGIRNIDKSYWIASRYTDSYSGSSGFYVRSVDANGSLNDFSELFYVYSHDSFHSNSYVFGLRPVFTLKSEVKVTGGSGTEESPYTLGI